MENFLVFLFVYVVMGVLSACMFTECFVEWLGNDRRVVNGSKKHRIKIKLCWTVYILILPFLGFLFGLALMLMVPLGFIFLPTLMVIECGEKTTCMVFVCNLFAVVVFGVLYVFGLIN